MAELSDLSLSDRLFVRTYRWRRIDPVPFTPLAKPLAECRLAIVSSAGLVLPEQEPFDKSVKGGDWGFREIPSDVDPSRLVDTHRSRSFDHGPMARDRNVAFPVERVRELARDGRIGSVGRRHLSFMGSITAPGRLVAHGAPEAAEILVQDEVDVALLVPV